MPENTKRRSFKSVLFAVHGLALALLFSVGYQFSHYHALIELEQVLESNADSLRLQLQNEMTRLNQTSDIAAESPQITQSLLLGLNLNVEQTSAELAEIQELSQASVVYMLSLQGEVLASSNSQQTDSFVGQNFSFRQYFRQAIDQGDGFELALGKVSNKRGGYFSKLVISENGPIGVVVVKADIDQMERSPHLFALPTGLGYLVHDSTGQIFMSDHAQLHLGNIQQFSPVSETGLFKLPNSMMFKRNSSGQPILFQQAFLKEQPWQIQVFSGVKDIEQQAFWIGVWSCLVYLAGLGFLLFYRERLKNVKRLRQSHLRLEQQVVARTRDLTDTNEQLKAEVKQRTQAEKELIEAQEQLVQTAKLATIGQLSSSINHEINQPVSALSTYLQNTRKMLDKDMTDEAKQNLIQMQQIIARIIKLVGQFKDFSRKSNAQLESVNVYHMVNDALSIVQPHIKSNQVDVKLKTVEQVHVNADPIRLEQVVINLLSNAVDALQQVPSPVIKIEIGRIEERPYISIADNGAGIQPHYLNQVFEPFFTTKAQNGLGLGLSISHNIIESFGAELNVANTKQGGACFTILFPTGAESHE